MNQPRTLTYGLAEFPMAMAAFTMAVIIPPFYVRDMGLALGLVAVILVAARCIDLLTDPLVGFLSDRTRGPWGRRKPWIAAGLPLMLVAVVALFTPHRDVDALHLAVWTIVLWLGWTMVVIPYYAWGAELSPGYHQRTRIACWRTLCGVAGILLALTVPVLSQRLFGYGAALDEALTLIAVIAVTAGVAAFTWLLARVPEAAPRQRRQISTLEGLRFMWRNRPYKRLMISFILGSMGPAMAGPVLLFYMDHVIQADVSITLALLAFYGANLLGVGLWGRVAERLDKRRAWMSGMALLAAVQPGFLLLGPGQETAMLVLLLAAGLGAGSMVALPSAMTADVVDVDRLTSGADRTGLFFSTWCLAQKAVTTLAMGLALGILALADFTARGSSGGAQIWALKAAFAGVPMLCYAAALLAIRPYPITESRHRQVLGQLAARGA